MQAFVYHAQSVFFFCYSQGFLLLVVRFYRALQIRTRNGHGFAHVLSAISSESRLISLLVSHPCWPWEFFASALHTEHTLLLLFAVKTWICSMLN